MQQSLFDNKTALRWVRADRGMVLGVCKGIAQSYKMDPLLVRLALVGSVLFFGVGIAIYLVLAISLPKEFEVTTAYEKRMLGVCSKVATRLEIEVGLVRSGFLLLAISTLSISAFFYVILHFILKDDTSN